MFHIDRVLGTLKEMEESKFTWISQYIHRDKQRFSFSPGWTPIVKIGRQWYTFGHITQQHPKSATWIHDRDFTLAEVFKCLNSDSISLNHIWVCYTPQKLDLDKEVLRIVNAMKGNICSVYEDSVWREEDMRWLFLWDAKSWGPMFEIVLPQKKLNIPSHFQVDIDTELPQEEINTRIWECFGNNFFDWSLDIPGIWEVLSMGTLNNQQAIDIRIGIWNNKRSREAHRKSLTSLN